MKVMNLNLLNCVLTGQQTTGCQPTSCTDGRRFTNRLLILFSVSCKVQLKVKTGSVKTQVKPKILVASNWACNT